MSNNVLILIGIIVGVGILSGLLVYLRASILGSPADIEAKGLQAVRKQTTIFYAVYVPVIVGVIAFFVYRFVNVRWPANADTIFLLLAVGIAVLFEIMAVIVFKMRGLAELTVLHLLYIFSFGWLMPRLFI